MKEEKVYGRTMILQELHQAKARGAGFALKLDFPDVDGELLAVGTPLFLDFYASLIHSTFNEKGETDSGVRIAGYQVVETSGEKESYGATGINPYDLLD